MKRCVIVGGADIKDYNAVRNYLGENDYYIFCDCGLRHKEALGVKADLLVGDFDSWSIGKQKPCSALSQGFSDKEGQMLCSSSSAPDDNSLKGPLLMPGQMGKKFTDAGQETVVIPEQKFDVDTVYGIREGISRGFDNFLLIGVIGERFDFSLCNLYSLVMLHSLGKKGMIVDDYSDMQLVSEEPCEIPDSYPYFSVLNITGIAKGISIENAKYTQLFNNEITCDYQYGLSNEVLRGRTATVSVAEGMALLVRLRRKRL